ncbi:MAG: hypothetical protein U0491_02650 [Candidatus Saccharimonadales bacterium]
MSFEFTPKSVSRGTNVLHQCTYTSAKILDAWLESSNDPDAMDDNDKKVLEQKVDANRKLCQQIAAGGLRVTIDTLAGNRIARGTLVAVDPDAATLTIQPKNEQDDAIRIQYATMGVSQAIEPYDTAPVIAHTTPLVDLKVDGFNPGKEYLVN